MKKITAFILSSAVALALCAPALSGCGGEAVKYTLSEEGGKHYIVSCSSFSNLSGEYEIPAYYGEGENYAPVTEIAKEGFAGTRFTKITVPETVTKIGVACFSFCRLLKTVEFADGISLEKFSHGAFGESGSLQQIKIPDSVTVIDGLCFSGCTSLSSVTLGSSLEVIGARAFENCVALESVILPQSLTTIGNSAFYDTGIKSIEIPDSVHDITDGETTVYGFGLGAFEGCVNLESATIGRGIKVIPSGAFGYCIKLKEIHVPLSVEEVQGAYYENGTLLYGHAFYGDTALTDIYYAGGEGQWKDIKIDEKTVSANGITMDNSALAGAIKHFNYKAGE